MWKADETDLERHVSGPVALFERKFMTRKVKHKTKVQLDKEADRRLQKTYNITLREYDEMARRSNGLCWVSGKPAGTRRLHVDHDHSWKKVKIETTKLKEGWEAVATYNGSEFVGFNAKKSLVIRKVKRDLLRASVRGLLSYQINSGIQKFGDDPRLLRAAADYLENFQKGSPLSGQETK
jgi:hypothetical protein